MDNMGGNNIGFQQVCADETRNYNSRTPVSTGKWVGIHFIKWIPAVGGIIYLVMLFIWAFGKDNEDETFRNWAKSELIMTAVLVVIWVVLIVAFGAFFASIYSNMSNEMFLETPMY